MHFLFRSFLTAAARWVAILLVALAPGGAWAQNVWATISGDVTDATRAGIAGARVEIEGGSFSRQIETGATGNYTLSMLPPGRYTVSASALGFRRFVRTDVSAAAGEVVRVKFPLEVGSVTETLVVSGRLDLVQTERASRSSVVTSMQMQTLPLLGRQVYNVLSLSPGVLFAQEEFGSYGYNGVRNWDLDGKYIINGGIAGTNQFLLNESPISLVGKWQFSPSVDAVDEVEVLTNTYDAQYGRTGGGTVLTSLKGGGNRWRGSAYEFLRNAQLDANSFDNNLAGISRGKHIAHQFGGVVSGPLRSNRDFLFLSLENYWEVAPSQVVADTPPTPLRDGQHFTQYKINIFDPATTRACTDPTCVSPYIRDPFPGNVIPPSRMSPIGRAILSLYPTPNERGVTQNYDATGNSGHFQYIQPIARWDHNFDERDRLYAFAAFDNDRERATENGFSGPAGIGGTNRRISQNAALDWTHVASPTAIWNVRGSFSRFTEYFRESDCGTCLTAASLGIHFPASLGANPAAPHIDFGIYSPIVGNASLWSTEEQLDLSPGATVTRGSHILHFGAEFAHAGLGQNDPGRPSGSFAFSRVWTQQFVGIARSYSDGSPVADLLLGTPSYGYLDRNDSYYRRWPYGAGYLQDNWKFRRNLTISLGLRYDVQIPWTELHGRFNETFDANAKSPLSGALLANWTAAKTAWDADHPDAPYPSPPAQIAGVITFPNSSHARLFKTDWTDIQPRVGVAWNFAHDTILRAGAGIFYRTATQLGASYGYDERTFYQRSLDGGLSPAAGLTGPDSLANPFPYGISPTLGSGAGALTAAGDPVVVYNRYRPIPRTYEYSFGLQRELPGLMLLEANYSGSMTVHDAVPLVLNPSAGSVPIPDPSRLDYLTTVVPNPLANGGVPRTSALGTAADLTIAGLLRPYPQFDQITLANAAFAKYRYDSLQLKLEKRVLDVAPAGIFSFVFAYTFSKSFAANHLLNPSDLSERPIHELSPGDRPQSIGVAGTWDMPFGWGRRYFSQVHPAVASLINSWSLDWIYLYQSGTPVTEPDATFTCSSFDAPGGQTAQHWFNNDRSCWAPRPSWAYKTFPDRFSTIRTPTAGQLNLSVEKTVWLSERVSVQLRGEAYNVTNTPILSAPVTDLTDPRFGQLTLTQQNLARFVQLALRVNF